MTLLDTPIATCTVIVTFTCAPEFVPEVETHARIGLELMHGLDGFVSGVLHRADERGRIVQLLRWRCAEDYTAWRQHPLWRDLPSSRRLAHLENTRKLRVEVQSYDVLHTTALDAVG